MGIDHGRGWPFGFGARGYDGWHGLLAAGRDRERDRAVGGQLWLWCRHLEREEGEWPCRLGGHRRWP